MVNLTTYTADVEFAAMLAAAAASGKRLRVETAEGTYELDVHAPTSMEDSASNYDAARLRAKLRELEAHPIFTEEEAEDIKRMIYEARERGTRPLERP